jgi:hypothetical protein
VRQAERRLHARQRRAQLMRHVVQQAALAIHQRAQACAHAVEVASQVDQFVAALGAGAEAWRQVTGGGGLEGAAQGADGT